MLSYLLFAILAGLAKGIALLILGLTGALISLLKPSTLRKKAVALIFVLSILSLRIVYVFNDITLLHLLLALLAPIIYVTAGVESVETTRTFAVGLFVFTLVSTVSSGILTIAILAPTLLGLLVLYGVERMIRRDTECTKNWLD